MYCILLLQQISDLILYLLLHYMCQTALVASYFTDYSFLSPSVQ